MSWESLPDFPDELGVAGAFVGVHNGALIVAGGANFPRPVWESEKVWTDSIYVLTRDGGEYVWHDAGRLHRPTAYGMTVSTPEGIVCMGGNDAEGTFESVFLLSWDPTTGSVSTTAYPSLPRPCAYGSATMIGDVIYIAGGQSDALLESAMTNFWSLSLSNRGDPERLVWQQLTPWPGASRAFNLTTQQHNGFDECVYVISGRRQVGPNRNDVEFLTDVWQYTPASQTWRSRTAVPRCVMAGTVVPQGQSHLLVIGGADGSLFFESDKLRDEHPGFPKQALVYHTITDRWTDGVETPINQVTTTAVIWDNAVVIPTGESRPRVRTSEVWRITPIPKDHSFGIINYIVLFGYLMSMVGIGIYFTRRNKNTDDFFRGGQNIPWWAAGCSIFATMLSSLTFTGIPSKAYAQDWTYAVGNFTIPVMAVVAVYIAMPFYRGIDATSAYEYLEKRFSRSLRLFGSLSFTLFHIFRMAVVMSLTGLALAVATPLTPLHSVLLMGTLSILYCTLGGIEAVIWTDTVQTVVLLGGALFAFTLLVCGVEDGVGGFLESAISADKFTIANFHWDVTSPQIAVWVIVFGALGQNLSSYTADQAVVQRYMTTANPKLAARSIWTNAILSIPATLLFFGLGTALFAFYQSHPDRLDPTITTDQVFPLFIAREMPLGVTGLIVAGIFAAAQSTVSTSMNSTASTIVTDLMRPLQICKTESGYLIAARWLTILTGLIGTLLAIVFIGPEIRSLFDTFLKVIGLFMGVLGGLFMLGVLTRRANATGATCGVLVGMVVMFWLWRFTSVNGYLYTTSGIATCFVAGYAASLFGPAVSNDLRGLTIYNIRGTSDGRT